MTWRKYFDDQEGESAQAWARREFCAIKRHNEEIIVTEHNVIFRRPKPKTGPKSKWLGNHIDRTFPIPAHISVIRRENGVLYVLNVGKDAPKRRCLGRIPDANIQMIDKAETDRRWQIFGTERRGQPRRLLAWGKTPINAWIALAIKLNLWTDITNQSKKSMVCHENNANSK